MQPHTRSIGIVAALSQEARTLSRVLPEPGEIGRLDAHVLLCVSGVGPGRARAAARRLVSRGASALISWGVAAALVPELKSGSVLLPHAVIAPDGVLLSVDGPWHEQVRAASSIEVRPIAQTNSLLVTCAQKQAFGNSVPAVAADMESVAVALVAQEAHVPFLVVRAIADEYAMSVPSWLMSCMDARGRIHASRFCAELLRHPRDLVTLARLARAFAAARAALVRFKSQHRQQLLAPA